MTKSEVREFIVENLRLVAVSEDDEAGVCRTEVMLLLDGEILSSVKIPAV